MAKKAKSKSTNTKNLEAQISAIEEAAQKARKQAEEELKAKIKEVISSKKMKYLKLERLSAKLRRTSRLLKTS